MKNILTVICLFLYLIAFSQKNYSKIKNSKINQARLEMSKKFINEFLSKCEKNDFAEFNQFKISKKLEKHLYNDVPKPCANFLNTFGKLKVLGLNSAYLNKKTKNYDPLDLYIFDIESEKVLSIKFISVWMYHDQNIIDGIRLSREKPWEKSKNKKKEPAL